MAKIIVLVSTLLLGGCDTTAAAFDAINAVLAIDLVNHLAN